MKNRVLFIFTFLSCSMFIYTSCDDSRIDLQPLSPTEASYFTEEGHYTKAIIGVYAKLTDLYWYNGGNSLHAFWELPGDDITTTGTVSFELFGTLQPADGRVNTVYQVTYQLINRANTAIQKLNAESGLISTPEYKNSMMGEALFLRGYGNFLLWNYFGTAPLINERIQSSEGITPSNSSGTELLDQAIADFTSAANLLPASWELTNRGRVTKSSANGMLGKALVFKGSATQSTESFSAAMAAFDNIADKSLMDDFADNFNALTENNDESLFEFQASQPDNDNVWLPNDFQAGGVGSTSAYWGFFENHYSLFGSAPFIGTQKLMDAFEEGDPRIASTIDTEDLSFKKYWSTGELKTNTGVGSANNPRILRYADILLLKAEAILESGGSTSAAIDLINQVRTRARNMNPEGTAPANYSTAESDKGKVFDWINKERLMELAGEEGARWLDLRRWHMAGKINLGAGFDFSSARDDVSFDVSKNLLYPIPLNETDLNPNIQQNSGY